VYNGGRTQESSRAKILTVREHETATPSTKSPPCNRSFQVFSFSFAYINLLYQPRVPPVLTGAAAACRGLGTGEHRAVDFDWMGIVPCVALLSCAIVCL
jgi:hypothetical protein